MDDHFLSDESSVIDAMYEIIEGGTDGDYFSRLTYTIVRRVDEHAGSYRWRKDALMAKFRSIGNVPGSWINN